MTVTGTVRSPEGAPIAGVLVMGADLNYAETDAEGFFRLNRPELALFFWCTGFLPHARPISDEVHVVLERTRTARAVAQ